MSIEVRAQRGGSARTSEVRLVLEGTYFFRRLHTTRTFPSKTLTMRDVGDLRTFEVGEKVELRMVTTEGATFRTSTGEHFTVKLEGIESILQELPVPAGPLRTAWDWLNLGDDA